MEQGLKVKGKKWERTMKGRLEKRRVAMLEMPKMVQQWKQVSWLHFVRYFGGELVLLCRMGADGCVVVGSWTRVEEVAEMRALGVTDASLIGELSLVYGSLKPLG